MTLAQIYRDVMKKPRVLTPEELELVLKEAAWSEVFDLCMLSPRPEPMLLKRLGELKTEATS